MKLIVRAKVRKPLEVIKQGFTLELFKMLNPPFPPAKVQRFDGCKPGDRVVIKLNFLLFTELWESLITSERNKQDFWEFVDEGVVLPFFLKSWRHAHQVKEEGEHSVITEDIDFSTGIKLLDYFFYPLLFLQFAYRIPRYRQFFA